MVWSISSRLFPSPFGKSTVSWGDGIYDQEPVYETVAHHSPGAAVIIPPRKDAIPSNDSTGVLSQRNRHIAEILSKGRPSWKRLVGYYSQSKAENVMYRYKKRIGEIITYPSAWGSHFPSLVGL